MQVISYRVLGVRTKQDGQHARQVRAWQLAVEAQQILIEEGRKWSGWPPERVAVEEARLASLQARLQALQESPTGPASGDGLPAEVQLSAPMD